MDFGLRERGLLMLCKSEETLHEESLTAEYAQRLGVPCEILDQNGVTRLEPGIEVAVAGAIYFPKDCHLQPERLIAALEQKVRKNGGEFLWDSAVEGIRWGGRQVAAACVSGKGEVEGDEFILASGSWSPEVASLLGLNLPMQAGKGYSLTLSKPPQQPAICSILTEARVACTPMGDQLRFGGTMEIAGMNDQSINPRRIRGIVKAVPEYFPAFRETDFAEVKPWSGLRPCSPDGLPYLGRTLAAENVIVAAGHAMLGVSTAPATGRLVASLIGNEELPLDLSLLSPDRYA
jgi:D-amino-acid dehydrogenase